MRSSVAALSPWFWTVRSTCNRRHRACFGQGAHPGPGHLGCDVGHLRHLPMQGPPFLTARASPESGEQIISDECRAAIVCRRGWGDGGRSGGQGVGAPIVAGRSTAVDIGPKSRVLWLRLDEIRSVLRTAMESWKPPRASDSEPGRFAAVHYRCGDVSHIATH